MGKSIQAISLIAAHRLSEPTLVICPVVALMQVLRYSHSKSRFRLIVVMIFQWRDQIEMHTTPGAFKVLIYHGFDRGTDDGLFDGYSIVLTTYSVIEVPILCVSHTSAEFSKS